VIAWLAGAHPQVTALALLVVAATWLWVGYQSYRTKARPANTTVVVMLAATALLAFALAWLILEPYVVTSLLQ
jgi:hypothetical protein